MKMNPICERASRAAARTPRFSASLCGGNALLSAVAIFLLGLMFQRAENTGELRYEEVLGVFHALIWRNWHSRLSWYRRVRRVP